MSQYEVKLSLVFLVGRDYPTIDKGLCKSLGDLVAAETVGFMERQCDFLNIGIGHSSTHIEVKHVIKKE